MNDVQQMMPPSPNKFTTVSEVVRFGDTEIPLNAFNSPGFIIVATLVATIIIAILYIKFIHNPIIRRRKRK